MYFPNVIICCVILSVICGFGTCAYVRTFEYEDEFKTVPELLAKYGYPIESHYVTTEDGYILTIFRIPSKINQPDVPPVLVVHGLFGAASDFIVKGPRNSLAYVLSDNNYDVWLLNCRGTRYSTNHTSLEKNSHQYWNFSYHEMGIYDISAAIDGVLKVTGHNQLFHIGHSQGCASLYVLLSERPEYNSRIKAHIGYGAAAFVCHPMDILQILSIPEKYGFWTRVRLDVGDFNIGPYYLTRFLKLGSVCSKTSPFFSLCIAIMSSFGQVTSNQLDAGFIRVMLGHYPAGGSTKQLVHYAQGINSCDFLQYRDEVSEKPTKYNMKNIVAPMYIFYGQKDGLSSPRDITRFKRELTNGFTEGIYIKNWAHNDFIFANEANSIIYNKTLMYLKNELT